jgi:hypothetical protein
VLAYMASTPGDVTAAPPRPGPTVEVVR